MSRIRRFLSRAILSCTALASVGASIGGASAQETAKRPNILVIVADDLGYSDIGAFGGEISTPNLDKLALGGLRLTGFHTAPACSPTRSMLLSGTDSHRAGLGAMAESIAANQKGQPGYEGYLRPEVASLPERLREGGYRTLFSGKWHLGLAPEQDPHARGFDQSFALLQGAHNHFGLDIATVPGKGVTYTENGKILTKLPTDFYSSDYFATRLIDELRTSRTGAESKKPFFAYLAFTAPHWPLQARDADIAKYKGRYDAGFEALRDQRLKRQEELGLVAKGTVAHGARVPRGGWDWLSAEQKRSAARDMEIYAAMVDRLDQNVGRVIESLRQSGELDNTIIVFLADNGAEGLDAETTGLDLLKERLARAENSLPNRGRGTSYVTYGPGWAQAATAPSWAIKGYASEGGTRTVSFVWWKGLAQPGTIGRAFASVADVAPTLIDVAGIEAKGDSFRGKTVLPITGKSWLPWLTGRSKQVYEAQDAVGTELFGSRSVRQGDWKITDIGDNHWRLFDVAADPGETRDLSLEKPDVLQKLIVAWDDYARQNGVILPDKVAYRP